MITQKDFFLVLIVDQRTVLVVVTSLIIGILIGICLSSLHRSFKNRNYQRDVLENFKGYK